MEQTKKYFNGVELSREETEKNRVSFYTLTKNIDLVLCNNIDVVDPYIWDNVINGELYEYDEEEAKNDYENLSTEEKEEYDNDFNNWYNDNKYNYESDSIDIYQYYLFNGSNYEIELLKEAQQLILYSDKLDVYILCVTHFGTAWCGVDTCIKIDESKD